MNATKEKILQTALKLYNNQGVASISIRQLAQELDMSHSNLTYHFAGHEEIILSLHDQMLQKAIKLNQELKTEPISLKQFLQNTRVGFSVVYDFRFLFNDLKYICQTFPKVKKVLVAVQEVRAQMYQTLIQDLIANNLMRKENFENEYAHLITLIKIYSDHWLVSSNIYDTLSKQEKIEKYSQLLLSFFYPYLTEKGRREFSGVK